MFDICVVVLCGIPGSGKSTFAKSIITKQTSLENSVDWGLRSDSTATHWLLVSYDDIMPSDLEKDIIEKEIPNAWKECRENIQNAVESIVRELQKNTVATEAYSIGKETRDYHFESFKLFLQNLTHQEDGTIIILIDDNMYYSSMRYKYYQLARKYGVGFCQVHIECDPNLALIRNRQRLSRQVPDDVILKMATRFEVPNPDQNSWEKHSLTVNTNSSPEALENSLIETIEVIQRALADPMKPVLEEVDPASREEDRKICSENMIHQADLIMRKLIAENMKKASGRTADKTYVRTLSASFSDIKSDILQKLKRGVVYFNSLENMTDKLREIFYEKMMEAGYG